LVVINETLHRKWLPTSTDTNFQYVLPSTYRNQVLTLLHNDQLAGHLGFKLTLARVKDRFYWASLHLSVERWCKRFCKECQKRNQPTRRPKGPMKTYVVGKPLERISLDILGPVTRTHTGNKYILVGTDYFTRFAEAYGLPDIETPTVAEKLLTEFICRYGLPLQIRTDQGAQFTSDLFVELCKRLSICKTRHSPFHPQSSGLVERLNHTIEDMLSKFVSKHQKNWDKYLLFLMMAYRSSVHETLGETPCFMMMGREATLPVDLIYRRYKTHENDLIPEYVETLMNRLEKVHEVVRCKLVSASERQ
jgi:transposase InsO family protein